MKQLQEQHPDLAGPLSDLWNTLLDHRILVLKDIFDDETLDAFGLRADMIRFLRKQINIWTSEDQSNMS